MGVRGNVCGQGLSPWWSNPLFLRVASSRFRYDMFSLENQSHGEGLDSFSVWSCSLQEVPGGGG